MIKQNIPTNREPLPVDCTNADTPTIRVRSSQLGDVARHFAVGVALSSPVHLLYILYEILEVWNDELTSERPRNQYNVGRNHFLKSFSI